MIPLNVSWTTQDVSAILQGKPKDFPGLFTAALWPSVDGSSFYSYNGGYWRTDPNTFYPELQNRLWEFTPNSSGLGDWSPITPPPDSNYTLLSKTTGSLQASYNGLSFVLGGYVSVVPISGMVMFNESTQQWWNLSSTGYSWQGEAVGGTAQFVPSFGPQGLLFVFGGSVNDVKVAFDYVFMFEPLSQQWRKQLTSGTPPSPVTLLWVVGVEGDDGTYEIFLHGGFADDIETTIAQGAVWSLTLPAFHWQRHSPDPQYGRNRHACSVAVNRQMIVVGGVTKTIESTLDGIPVEPWPRSIGVYDLSNLQWKDNFNANAEAYVTPDVVKEYYRANGSQPGEWTEEGVQAWFQASLSVNASTSNGSNATTPNGSGGGDGEGDGDGDSNTGAIAGGVVGGVVGLALLGGLAWLLVRRRRRQRQHATPRAGNDSEPLGVGYQDQRESHQLSAEEKLQRSPELDGRGLLGELPGAYEVHHELPGSEGRGEGIEYR